MKFELEPYNRGMPDATLLDDLRGVAQKLGKDCVTMDEYDKDGRWSASTLKRRFGSWTKAHILAGLRKVRNYDASPEDCIGDVGRVARSLEKSTLTMSEYKHDGVFPVCLIQRRCGSWKAAIERAGLSVSLLYHKRTTDEQLFENLEHLWESLGRQPRGGDFTGPLSKHSVDCYKRRFGSLRKALAAFVASFETREPEQSDEPIGETTIDLSPVPTPKWHRTPRNISGRMRFLVMRRDDFKCRICGTSPAMKPGTALVVDHIVPWVDGGETVMENLQTLCEPCNGGKSDLSMDAE